jgi:predicted deacylase
MKLCFQAVLSGLIIVCVTTFANAEQSTNSCGNEHISVSKNFETGRFASCKMPSTNVFELSLAPENKPINPSPWYAFVIDADKTSVITIVINYSHAKHRYWPQLSQDFENWQRLTTEQVVLSADAKQLTLQLNIKAGKTWIAAQPVIDNKSYKIWLEGIAKSLPSASLQDIGKSVQGRSLYVLESVTNNKKPVIVLFGRQHPPEVTGALALRAFVDTLMTDTPLAKKFRNEINVLILPNVNPDGVALGNWRHNMNGVDLNRDWGPFEQAETRQINEFIELYLSDKSLWTVIDFHSTSRDVFYIQQQEQESRFPHLIKSWMEAMVKAGSPIIFEAKPGHSPENPTTKTYFYEKYKVPTITYELGDNSNPLDIERSSQIAAISFMQLLLEQTTL